MSLGNENFKNSMSDVLAEAYDEYFQNNPRFADEKSAVNNELSKQPTYHKLRKKVICVSITMVITVLFYTTSPITLNLIKWKQQLFATIIFLMIIALETRFLFRIVKNISNVENEYWKNQTRKSLTEILSEKEHLNPKSVDDFIKEANEVINSKKSDLANKTSTLEQYVNLMLMILSIFAGFTALKENEFVVFIVILFIGIAITYYVLFKLFFGESMSKIVLSDLYNLEFFRKELRNVKNELSCYNQ